MHNPESFLQEIHKLLWDFEIQTDHLISARWPDLMIANNNDKRERERERERTWQIVDFAVLTDHRVKLKEREKRDKYLDLTRELKKLYNMNVTVIPIVVGTIGTIPKGLVKGLEDIEIRGQVETIQTTELLRSARIPRRVQETCCHSNSSEKPSSNTGVKDSQRSRIIIMEWRELIPKVQKN